MFKKVKYIIAVVIFSFSTVVLNNLTAQIGVWEEVGSFKDIAVNSIESNTNGVMFAGTYAGVYRSTDKGLSWDAVNQGLTDTNVNVVVIRYSNEVFAGT